MHIYLSTAGLASRILNIRGEYEKKTGRPLDSTPSNRVFTYFGAKDVVTRGQQIELMEKVAAYAKAKGTENILDSDMDALWPEKVRALRLLTAVSYVTHRQIKDAYSTRRLSYGTLDDLIVEKLESGDENYLDDNTKSECLSILMHADLAEVNQVLHKEGIKPITEKQWKGLTDKATQLHKPYVAPSKTPIADFLEKVGKLIGGIFGVGFGFVVGRVVGQSGASSSAKAALTAAIGGTFIFFGPAIGTGVVAATVMARSIAESAIDISAGYMGALLFRQAGQLVVGKAGRGAGLLLDSTAEGCGAVCEALGDFLNLSGDKKITRIGLNLATGGFAYQNKKGETQSLECFDEQGKPLSYKGILEKLKLVYSGHTEEPIPTQQLTFEDFAKIRELDLSELSGCSQEQIEHIQKFRASLLQFGSQGADISTLIPQEEEQQLQVDESVEEQRHTCTA